MKRRIEFSRSIGHRGFPKQLMLRLGKRLPGSSSFDEREFEVRRSAESAQLVIGCHGVPRFKESWSIEIGMTN